MLTSGRVSDIINDAHDSQVNSVARRIHDIPQPAPSFPLTDRAASLAGCGARGKACKLAFSYGTESDPIIGAIFPAKLTRATMHTHVPPHYLHTSPNSSQYRSRQFQMHSRECLRNRHLTVMDGRENFSAAWLDDRLQQDSSGDSWNSS